MCEGSLTRFPKQPGKGWRSAINDLGQGKMDPKEIPNFWHNGGRNGFAHKAQAEDSC